MMAASLMHTRAGVQTYKCIAVTYTHRTLPTTPHAFVLVFLGPILKNRSHFDKSFPQLIDWTPLLLHNIDNTLCYAITYCHS